MFDKVLSMPLVKNIPGFWIAQDLEYTSGSKCARVFDMPEFWIWFWFWLFHDSEYTSVTRGLEYDWIIPEHAWLCLDMSEYARTWINMAKSTRMTFVLHFPIAPFVLQSLVYLNTWLIIWTSTGD